MWKLTKHGEWCMSVIIKGDPTTLHITKNLGIYWWYIWQAVNGASCLAHGVDKKLDSAKKHAINAYKKMK